MRRAYGADVSRYREALSDDVIAIHDKQKDFSEAFWSRFAEAVGERVAAGGLLVDAGVGSGVVASPLAGAGFTVAGFDFNLSMLGALVRRSAGSLPVGLADVTALPVREACAEAVVMTNVLHLLRNWRDALCESARVLRPGGVLFLGRGNTSRSSVADEVGAHFRTAVGDAGVAPEIGVSSAEDFDAALSEVGLQTEEPLVVGEQVTRRVRDAIERLQHNVFTWPPDLPQAALDTAAEVTTEWALARYGSLDAEYQMDAKLRLEVARKVG